MTVSSRISIPIIFRGMGTLSEGTDLPYHFPFLSLINRVHIIEEKICPFFLSEFPVLGRPTILGNSRERAFCTCNRCGWVLFGHFSLVYNFIISLFFSLSLSLSLWETARYGLKYCLKGPLNSKQPTNQLSE